MAVLLNLPYSQFFDDNGDPLAGGLIYTYTAGTTTPKATYTDYSEVTPAANPIVLDSAGRAAIWIVGSYRIDVKTSTDVLVRSVDNITAYTSGGDMTKAVYDPANIAQQLVGTTAVQTLTNKTLAGTADPAVNNGRLTLTSGTPVTTADVTGATNIYFTPYNGNKVSVYSGTQWEMLTFTELTLALGTITSARPHDVFLDYNSGTPQLVLLAWTSDTARATALTYQNGVLVKSGTATQRYLGSFYTTSTTTTADALATRYLYNEYNTVIRGATAQISTASYTYTTATWRAANSITTNGDGRFSFLIGNVKDRVNITASRAAANTTNNTHTNGIALTGVTNAELVGTLGASALGAIATTPCHAIAIPRLGLNFAQAMETSVASGVTTWYGGATGGGMTAALPM